MGSGVFGYCSSLKYIVLHPTDYIGGNAVKGCTSLDRIYFKGSAAEWNSMDKTGLFDDENVNPDVYLYSDEEKSNCWHYVDGVPILWSE